jgi:hypothetical protein
MEDHELFTLESSFSGEIEDIQSKVFLKKKYDLLRLQSLYVKLYQSLRYLVHDIFLTSMDLLQAASELQVKYYYFLLLS